MRIVGPDQGHLAEPAQTMKMNRTILVPLRHADIQEVLSVADILQKGLDLLAYDLSVISVNEVR